MNKFFYGLSAAAVLALASCSNDELVKGGENENGEVGYLSVNIVSTQAGTRAPGDQTTGEPDKDGNHTATYEEGLASENAVEKVRFYFFNTEGAAANMKNAGGTYVNYYDWEPISYDTDMPNVEKTLNATIVLQKVNDAGDNISQSSYPAQMVAIINPGKVNLPTGSVSLTDLRKIAEDYAAIAVAGDNGFVMCNSSYVQGVPGTAEAARVSTSAIKSENVQNTPAAARANPVNIYVERCVAKVRVNFQGFTEIKTGDVVTAYKSAALKDKDNVELKYVDDDDNEQNIYLKITGWNLTATTSKGYLSKHLYATWPSALFGTQATSQAWNHAPYFRSFWAMNPNVEISGQNYFTYNQIGGLKNYLYTNENAGQATDNDDSNYLERDYPTQVIVAGQLVDNVGNAIEVCEFAGLRFAGLNNLKTHMVDFVNLYKVTVVGGVPTTTKITPADVELVTVHSVDPTNEGQDNHGRYYSVLKLTTEAEGATWTVGNTSTTPATETEIKAELSAVGRAKIWATGLTYYYFPIAHLGDATAKAGKHGVVRNHIYDCNVTAISGLGTPVYNPDEKVWPEVPEEPTDTYIAAKINVLSWRVVPNSVVLNSYDDPNE